MERRDTLGTLPPPRSGDADLADLERRIELVDCAATALAAI
jgi:hypothetical protein